MAASRLVAMGWPHLPTVVSDIFRQSSGCRPEAPGARAEDIRGLGESNGEAAKRCCPRLQSRPISFKWHRCPRSQVCMCACVMCVLLYMRVYVLACLCVCSFACLLPTAFIVIGRHGVRVVCVCVCRCKGALLVALLFIVRLRRLFLCCLLPGLVPVLRSGRKFVDTQSSATPA